MGNAEYMGIYIMSGQNTIKLDFLDINIEGPKSIHILKPKNIKDVNQNYIILLGDDHSIPFQPKTQGPYMDKFLFGLNKLAKYIRCDFYIEDWNVEKIKSFPQHNERQKKNADTKNFRNRLCLSEIRKCERV